MTIKLDSWSFFSSLLLLMLIGSIVISEYQKIVIKKGKNHEIKHGGQMCIEKNGLHSVCLSILNTINASRFLTNNNLFLLQGRK